MNTEHVEERRKDGSLKYECTKKWLRKSHQHLYPKRIITEKGTPFIRIGYATKYNRDGSIQWRLIYNAFGEVIGTHKGTTI